MLGHICIVCRCLSSRVLSISSEGEGTKTYLAEVEREFIVWSERVAEFSSGHPELGGRTREPTPRTQTYIYIC